MSYFIDYAWASLNKNGEELCGDRVESYRSESECIIVLSDGLGSGVKANILATLTAKIAITMLKEGLTIQEVVDTVTHTLPVCKVRELAYSTFTIVKVNKDGMAYIVEFDNPSLFHIKNNRIQSINSKVIEVNGKKIKESSIKLGEGDTMVFVSDGAIHAGVGKLMNLGWGWNEVGVFIEELPHYRLNSRDVTNRVLDACNTLYMDEPGDDTTVVTLKVTTPKLITLFAGPPKDRALDKEVVNELLRTKGKKIICGGTAANIVGREIGEEVKSSLMFYDKRIPPIGCLKGIDLVTEGVLTIRAAIKLINKINTSIDLSFLYEENGAAMLSRTLFEDCTHIKMLVGRAINPAHQNPDFPEELSIKYKLILELKESLERVGKVIDVVYY